MPWEDWQFWMVTAAAGAALWTLVRQVWPRQEGRGPACGGCASGAAACARRELEESA